MSIVRGYGWKFRRWGRAKRWSVRRFLCPHDGWGLLEQGGYEYGYLCCRCKMFERRLPDGGVVRGAP